MRKEEKDTADRVVKDSLRRHLSREENEKLFEKPRQECDGQGQPVCGGDATNPPEEQLHESACTVVGEDTRAGQEVGRGRREETQG